MQRHHASCVSPAQRHGTNLPRHGTPATSQANRSARRSSSREASSGFTASTRTRRGGASTSSSSGSYQVYEEEEESWDGQGGFYEW
jgi:hypothetical protein